VINLTNKTALYNFLSTFSGTHFVTHGRIQRNLAFISRQEPYRARSRLRAPSLDGVALAKA